MANRVVAIQQRLRSQLAAAELDVMRGCSTQAVDADLKLQEHHGRRKASWREQRAETVQERQAFIQKWRSDHNQQLVQARQDLAEATETLNKASRMQELTEITAPVDGTVLQVAGPLGSGSVLRARRKRW